MELLIHDLVERILEELPIKSLLKFESVSKQWKSTIESSHFKKRHLIRRQSQDPDILIINPLEFEGNIPFELKHENVTRMFTMGSSDLIKLPNLCPPRKLIPIENKRIEVYDNYLVSGSCDGMICYYTSYNCIYVVNPITRWSRSVPQARYQVIYLQVLNQDNWKGEKDILFWKLGFGKDKFSNTYKLVWLYNSFELGLENATTCEVFDFSTNTWRYVTAAPCRVLENQIPVYLDGSLHWFTDEGTGKITRVLSFDLRTETFQIISETPMFVQAPQNHKIIMCDLDNHLCVSQKEWPRQEIWSLNNSNMTWEKIYSLNLQIDSHLFPEDLPLCFIWPDTIQCIMHVAVLKKKKSLVLYDALSKSHNLTIYDPELKSYDICFPRDYKVSYRTIAVSFFPSLISIV